MKTFPIAKHYPQASRMVYGCMGLGGGWNQNPVAKEDIQATNTIIDTLLDNGVNFFDHADIYTFGKAEEVFGKVLKERPNLRDKMIIQSKCGIRFDDDKGPKRYDFSKEWIEQSIDNILKRLQIEQLDILLLHRPDPLMQAYEVAEVFAKLKKAGKVQHFGVSNMGHYQMMLLQSALDEPLLVNQLEMSLKQLDWVESSVMSGVAGGQAQNFGAGMLEYCQADGIQLQAWGSLAQGFFSGKDISNEAPHIHKTAELVQNCAEKYQVSKEAIVLAWLMYHPVSIQPVIGTTNIARIEACLEAEKVELTREDWYILYVSARGEELP